MTGLTEVQILKVALDEPFSAVLPRSEFLFAKRAEGEVSAWLLIDLCTPPPPGLIPLPGERCSWAEASGLETFLSRNAVPLNHPAAVSDNLGHDLRLRELRAEFAGTAPDREACLQLRFALMLLEFKRACGEVYRPAPLSEQRLEQVVRHMLAEYRYPWRVEELSELLNVSPSYLNKLCRRKYGMSPIDMLIQHRILMAKKYLRTPGARVNAVCEEVGFSDIYYFSRSFKKRCGVTPTEYMKGFTPPRLVFANSIAAA